MADLKLVGLQLQNPMFIWFTALGPIVVGIVATEFMVPSLSVVAFITAKLDSPRVNAPFDVPRFKLIDMGKEVESFGCNFLTYTLRTRCLFGVGVMIGTC